MKSHDKVFDAEDPRLTAYALGELEGDDRAEIERLIASDPLAAAVVDEMRTTAGLVEHEFAAEVVTASASIPAGAQKSIPNARTLGSSNRRRVLLQAAGLAAVLAGAAFLVQRSVSELHKVTPSTIDGSTARDDITASARESAGADSMSPAMAVVPASESSPAAATASEGKREAIDNTAIPVQSITVGHGGSGQPAPFSARKLGGSSGSSKAKGRESTTGAFYDRAGSADAGEKIAELYGNTEGYNAIVENAFKLAAQDPLSTFSIDVDTASYANVRRFLNDGMLPPVDAVRVEELINYFRYAYPAPQGDAPFSTSATVASCPWAPTHKLVQVGLRAKDIDMSKRLPSNFVFLLDVSGSMNDPDKLPLLKRSMRLLVDALDGRDKIAIVVYAGASGVALPSTSCDSKAAIEYAIESLRSQGSTNGAAGIELAYEIAAANRISEGQNRVILCTDGDFNVGVTDQGSLVELIEEKRKSGVFLSVLGFGKGNTKDSTMEMLADKGNGNYAYIDSINEARKVLVSEMGGTLFTVAKDVKIQVEFNPTRVQAWRLIGYENRQLAHQDFNDDKKDAGDIGAGHNVTAFYEVVPVGVKADVPSVDPLKYQQPTGTTSAAYTDELLTLKLRYKSPEGDTSQLISTPVADTNASFGEVSSDFRFAASVAAFGMVLRKSANVGTFGLQNVVDLAVPEVGDDVSGYRREFVALVRKAQGIEGKPKVR